MFFRRTVLRAADAINWYRTDASHEFLTPVPSNPAEVRDKLDGSAISSTNFVDDPEWPSLGLPIVSESLFGPGQPGDPAPFIGVGSGAARIHRRFGDNSGFGRFLSDTNAIEFVRRRIHVSLLDYQEYLGSLVLVAPDPVLRGVRHYIAPGAGGASEHLIYRLVPRPKQSLDGLKLTIVERRENLLSRFETIDVPHDGLVVVPRQLPVQSSGYVVAHPQLGVLEFQTPLPFIRKVNISMSVAARRVTVTAPQSESQKSKPANYEVMEYTQGPAPESGDGGDVSPLARIFTAAARRERRAQARRYEQTWFADGTRDEAMAFVRRHIQQARQTVIVADPYVGARQIMQFLHAVQRIDVTLTILTSRMAFEPLYSDEVDGGSSTDRGSSRQERVNAELRRLNEFQSAYRSFGSRGIPNVAAMVLTGKVPLHDRFLVVDEDVWFLGNSLNTLGHRASLILKVPDGEPILENIRRMLVRALPFEEYLNGRKQQLGDTAGNG